MKNTRIPFIITIIFFLVTASLGVWQIYRYVWKVSIIEKIKERIAIPEESISCNAIRNRSLHEDLSYRKFLISGILENSRSIFVYAGPRKFKGKTGYFVISPMRDLRASDKACYLIVNQGWIEENKRAEILSKPDTKVMMSTYFMPEEKRSSIFIPENKVGDDGQIWFYINGEEIAKHMKFPIANFYLMKRYDGEDIYPIGKDVTINIRNNHLEYVFTWFSFAITILVIYFIYRRKIKYGSKIQ